MSYKNSLSHSQEYLCLEVAIHVDSSEYRIPNKTYFVRLISLLDEPDKSLTHRLMSISPITIEFVFPFKIKRNKRPTVLVCSKKVVQTDKLLHVCHLYVCLYTRILKYDLSFCIIRQLNTFCIFQ